MRKPIYALIMTHIALPQPIREACQNFLDLFFPPSCTACHAPLLTGEEHICTACRVELPRTNFHLLPSSPLERLFWGRLPVEGVWAYLRYTKGGKVQSLLHGLKYKGRQPVGLMLGEWFGAALRKSPNVPEFDFIVPVPLHKRRLRERGYNQSDLIADGLSKSLQVPVRKRLAFRKEATGTQTKRSRYNRWLNVSTVFEVEAPERELEGKKVLLVDDVLTTGATLEALGQAFVEKGATVGIAVLAYAR